MIVTVTMNAAIDKTYIAPGFQPGSLYRLNDMYTYAGGKGINVARVIQTLGEEVVATGIVAGFNGRFIEAELDREGIPHQFVPVDGESRLCLNIIDPETNRQTELLESGPTMNEISLAAMKRKLANLAEKASYVIMSGSLPQGCPTSYYAELIEIVRQAGAIPVLDTSGESLLQGISAQPALIKPNEHEVLKLTGGTEVDLNAIKAAIQQVMDNGVPHVVVSLGADGALAGMNGKLYQVTIPEIQVLNTVGCGDSMLAGIIVAATRGLSEVEQLRLGAACGTANALMPSAGSILMTDVDTLMHKIEVVEL